MYLWKSNLNEITSDHANEKYEVNMWGKCCRIYPEFAPKKQNKKTSALFKGTTNIRKLTAVSDQVLNCQPKILILNNIPSLSYYYWGRSVQQILFPPFRYSGPVDSWCSQVLDQCSFGFFFNPDNVALSSPRLSGIQTHNISGDWH